jgi:hypothetical protein
MVFGSKSLLKNKYYSDILSNFLRISDPQAVTVPAPRLSQVSSFLSARKIREFGRVADITLLSLRQATEPYREISNDMDEGYVIDAVFDGTDPLHGKFCIVWSTRRMSTADVGEVIHCDCTYKCAWNDYPITMLGFSDKNRKFHPVILAVSTHETFSEFFHILSAWRNVIQI